MIQVLVLNSLVHIAYVGGSDPLLLLSLLRPLRIIP